MIRKEQQAISDLQEKAAEGMTGKTRYRNASHALRILPGILLLTASLILCPVYHAGAVVTVGETYGNVMDPALRGWEKPVNNFTDADLAVNQEETMIHQVQNWTDYEDSRYSFTLTASEQTCFESFAENIRGNWPSDPVQVQAIRNAFHSWPLTTVSHETSIPIYSAIAVVPQNEQYLLGNCGVWIRHAGVYQGRAVDCRCIFIFEKMVKEGDPREVYPTIVISARKDGIFGFDTGDQAVEVEFQLYWSGTNEPAPVNMCLNFGDVDSGQTYGFRTNNGQVHLLEVSPQCQLYYQHEKAGSEYYEQHPGQANPLRAYYWMSSRRDVDLKVEPDPRGEFRIEVDNCSDFNIVYASWLRLNKVRLRDNRYLIGEDEMTQDFEDCYSRYTQTIAQFQNGTYEPAKFQNVTSGIGEHGIRRAFLSYFTAYPYSQYLLPVPAAAVSDCDEPSDGAGEDGGMSNTLSPSEDIFTYHITQSIPEERPEYRYRSFAITDQIPAEVVCDTAGIRIRDDAGSDVSSRFVCTQTDGRLNIAAVPGTDGRISQPEFYNTTYHIDIPCMLSDEALQEEGTHSFTNYVTSTAVTTVGSETAVQTADSRMEGENRTVNPQHVVTTTYTNMGTYQDPYIHLTARVDDVIPGYGDAVFLYRISDGENGYTAAVRIDPDTRCGSASLPVRCSSLRRGSVYTITELPNARYPDLSAAAGKDADFSAAEHGISVRVHSRRTPAEPETVEVTFEHQLYCSGRSGNADLAVNPVRAGN